MQITETSVDGLKRTLKVVVGQAELGEKFSARLGEIKDRVQLKGFRKGKVPLPHLKKVYGRAVMAEVVEELVKDTSAKAIKDRNEKPAAQPKIEFTEDKGEIDKVMAGEADLAYSMSFEVLPPIPVMDLTTLKLEQVTADVDDAAIDKALGEIADRNVSFEPEDGRAAQSGDRVKVDFVGRIDGEAFEGGSGEGMHLVLGSRTFIPGFEEGLTGITAGEERLIKADFPADYQMPTLAGKSAEFTVKAIEVARPIKPEINDAFAETLGVENLAKMKELVKAQIEKEYADASRLKLKREILDALDKGHDFNLPPSLVDNEFEVIWKQLTDGMRGSGKTFADEGKTEEEARAEYRSIAERRVRLGLVIGEIGDKNKISVSQDELRAALIQQARRFPGQEKMVYEFYEKTPGAVAELRAPIFEDKVIDHIIGQMDKSERKVSRDELFKMVEEATQN